jgi:hypothetical protein
MKKSDFIEIMKRTQAPLGPMVDMVPDDKLDWAPAKGFMNVGQLLKHMSENWCIIRMMVTQDWPFAKPEDMEEAMKLENLKSCSKAEAKAAMEKDLNEAVAYLEKEIPEEDLLTKKVSAPWGFDGEIWKAVLMAKEHLVNHKMQLHLYLKMLGMPVHTGTLYGM